MYLRTEFLLLDLETSNEVEFVIVHHDAYWLKTDELKLMIEVIPVLILNIIVPVLIYFLI